MRNVRLNESWCSFSEGEPSIEFMIGRLRGVRNDELQLGRPELKDAGNVNPEDFGRIGRLKLGLATLVVGEGSRQVVSFTGIRNGVLEKGLTEFSDVGIELRERLLFVVCLYGESSR